MTHSTNALHLFNSKQEFPVAGVQAGKVALNSHNPNQDGVKLSRIDDIFISKDLVHPHTTISIVPTAGDRV